MTYIYKYWWRLLNALIGCVTPSLCVGWSVVICGGFQVGCGVFFYNIMMIIIINYYHGYRTNMAGGGYLSFIWVLFCLYILIIGKDDRES